MDRTLTPNRFVAAGLLLLIAALPVAAHHSGAMFDSQQSITLQGTVKEFRWGNPHCWIQLLVPRNGVDVEWSIEMGSTMQLYRSGWRPGTLQSGGKVTIVAHPLRDGTPGAQFVSALGPDGAPLEKPRSSGTP